MKPIDPRLLREARATTWFIATVVAFALLATASTVLIAFALASFIVRIFVDGATLEQEIYWLGIALAAAGVRAGVHFAQEWAGFRAANSVKLRLRERALDVTSAHGDSLVSRTGTGQLSLLLGPALESLDVYFAKYIPQLVFTAIVTPIFVALVWLLDFTSAMALVFTIPLIPLFMILIGLVTRDVQQKQLNALEKLNGHFYEILRGIQTLKIFGRTNRQREILGQVAMQYRDRTMKVLRVSFLSGFALELAASLSVALIAVTIGLRLVDGQIDLLTGLFVLLIAPEAYLPLRNVGAQFHASAQGVEVSARVLDLIDSKPIAQDDQKLELEPGVTGVTGPSGVGKTMLLKAQRSADSAWMPQKSSLLTGSVKENIVGFDGFDPEMLSRAIEFSALDDIDLELEVAGNIRLSGGQIQRVALARTLYQGLSSNCSIIILDEPVSQQDLERQERIAQGLRRLADEGYKLLVASHQGSMVEIFDREVSLAAKASS